MAKLGYTAAQIRAAEVPLLERGVPLMARASAALADHALSLLPVPKSSRVAVVAGAGDNGGDALHAAAAIARAGVTVTIIAAMSYLHEAGATAALTAGATLLGTQSSPTDPVAAAECAATSDLVIDGVLGIGAGGIAAGGTPVLRGHAREVVAAIKSAIASASPRPLVIAVDLPSGVDPDSGEVADPDAVLPADLTITFIGIKAGLLRGDGARVAGKVWLEPIGASQQLLGVTPAITVD